ncbi:hypothetical protein ACO22_03300 [Paracoccidioides brasiliensis]|uniref:Uncharacterized protein n=1 Tax=Paracoccidioides brasiliensis TaxID=121759 RepID=A0A1D2JGC0_PARBR|nr:hypothetical protein ACO22_03300 [Paracoccidioides brasiliensis]
MADFYQSPYALTTGPIFAIMEHIIQPDMTLSMAIHELFSFDSFAQRTNHLGVPAATLDGIVAGQVANGGTNHLRNHDSAFVGRIPVLDFELQFRDRDALPALEIHRAHATGQLGLFNDGGSFRSIKRVREGLGSETGKNSIIRGG